MTNGPVEPRPAATVVLLREGPAGLEALLTQRPATMAFAPDVHVFPGGRVDAGRGAASLVARSVISPAEAAAALGGDLEPGPALAAYVAAIRELFEEAGVLLADVGGPGPDATRGSAARSALLRGETTLAEVADELDLRLRTDRLVPLSRWVTPPTMPRRFDARFFAAACRPARSRRSRATRWPRTRGCARPTRSRRWPTGGSPCGCRRARPSSSSSTPDRSRRSATRLAPGRLGPIEVAEPVHGVTRIVMPAGGGVAGQPVCAYLVGRRRFVLVDPGDPSGPALERALALARARGGAIEAVVLTHVDPDHAAGRRGRRRDPRDPGARRSRWRRVAAVRDARAARPRRARRR